LIYYYYYYNYIKYIYIVIRIRTYLSTHVLIYMGLYFRVDP